MIVPMKKVSVVVQTCDKTDMLFELRKSGLMHIYSENLRTQKGEELQKRNDSLYMVRTLIEESIKDKKANVNMEKVSYENFEKIHNELLANYQKRKELLENVSKDKITIDQIKGWGEFNPETVEKLRKEGINLYFYTIGKKEMELLDDSIQYIMLDPVEKQSAIAVVGTPLDPSFPARLFELPKLGLSELKKQVEEDEMKIKQIDSLFESHQCHLDSYSYFIKKSEMDINFEKIYSQMEGGDNLSYVTGFIPVSKLERFEKIARKNSWGYLTEDPTEEDNPPTLVKYKKGVGIIKPLFDILGTVPGYYEGDISQWFLMFFTLFFAMIIGDAGYGSVFLIGAIIMQVKSKKMTTANILLYVLSIGTMIWGSLTGTWFGSQTLLINTPLKYLVIPSIANYPSYFGIDAKLAQNNIMQFCFILGTIQLSLAEVINIVRKLRKKDISFIADIGWTMEILTLYFVVLNLVIQAPCDYSKVFPIVIIGFVSVIVFGSQKPGQSFVKGIGAGLGGLFTTFLDTISCFSNIMSYIRLFAVGLATLAIAQSFNAMAAPMLGGVTTIVGILILIIGHGLNLIMGLLSVIVHGVRLNLLEFSGQLGMEWSGIEYEPFEETVNE